MLCFRRFAVPMYGLAAAKTTNTAISEHFPVQKIYCVQTLLSEFPPNRSGTASDYPEILIFHEIASELHSAHFRKMWAFINRQTTLSDITELKKPKCEKAVSRSHIKHTLS
ncbi:MAG: hypothetical protein IKL10_04125 [Clostridia bacterium]|nr:hypothetical protein [Clostridia bacterium]